MGNSTPTRAADQCSDEYLIARIADGDKAAMAVLYRRHYKRTLHFVLRILHNVEDSEDIVAAVFSDVWQVAGTFQGRSKVTTWLLRIAYNQACNLLRKSKPNQLDEDNAANIPDPADTPEASLIKSDLARHVHGLLAILPPIHRQILELAYYEDRTVGDIAGILSIPEGTVKTRMFYARERLRDMMR